MGVINDIENNLRGRINRVNPGASIFTRPTDRKQDWLRGSLDRISQYAREREEEKRRAEEARQAAALRLKQRDDEQSKRAQQVGFQQERAVARQRFVDENAGKNVGSFSDRGAGRLAVARGNSQEMRARGTLGAFAGVDDRALKTWGQGYKQAYRDDLGNFFDQNLAKPWEREREVRAFVLSGLESKEKPAWLESYRADFIRNGGRGLQWKDWEEFARQDPIGFLAAADPIGTRIEVSSHFGTEVPDEIRLPEPVGQAVVERRQLEPKIVGAYAKNRTTPGQEFFRSGRGSLFGQEFNFGLPGDSTAEKLAGSLAGGMTRQIETQSSALAQLGLDARIGNRRAPWANPQAARNVDRNVGTHFGDMSTRQKWGTALDAAITDLALVTPGKFGGSTVLNRLGIAATPGRKAALDFGIGGATALAYDVPGNIAALKLQGYSDDEIKKLLPMVVAGDLLGAGLFGQSKALGGKLGEALGPAGRAAGASAGAGLASYGLQRGFGVDEEQARRNSMLLGAGLFGTSALGRAGEAVGRKGLTFETPEGFRHVHGTAHTGREIDTPRPGQRGELGPAFYTNPLKGGAQSASEYAELKGRTVEGAPYMQEYEAPRGQRWLEAHGKVLPKEMTPIRKALQETLAEKYPGKGKFLSPEAREALSDFDRRLKEQRGVERPRHYAYTEDMKLGPNDVSGLAVREALLGNPRLSELEADLVIQKAGWDGLTAPKDFHGPTRQFAHLAPELLLNVVSGQAERVKSIIRHFQSQKVDTTTDRADPSRGGMAPVPEARNPVETKVDAALDQYYRGEDGRLQMDAQDLVDLWTEASGGRVYPGFGPRLSLDDMRYAFEQGLPGARWYDVFGQVIDDLLGDKGGDKTRALLSKFGITSQQAPPAVNLERMLNAMTLINELTEGGTKELDFGAFKDLSNSRAYGLDDHQLRKIKQVYDEGWAATTSPGASKTPSYVQNLIDGLLKRYSPFATVDTHHGAYFGFLRDVDGKWDLRDAAANNSDAAYAFANRITQHLAAEYGVEPKYLQAAMWETMKKAKEAKDADGNYLVEKFNNGEMTWKELVDQSRNWKTSGDHITALGDPKVKEAFDRFVESSDKFGDATESAGSKGFLEYAPSSAKAQKEFAVNAAVGDMLRETVAKDSPVIDFSTKPGDLGREADPAEQVALQRARLRQMGFDANGQHPALNEAGIRHEVIEESLGSWNGVEPNVRIRIVGGNYASAEYAAALLAKAAENAGLQQDAMAIHLPKSQVGTYRGFEIQKPDGRAFTTPELANLERALHLTPAQPGVSLKVGDPTTVRVNQYFDFDNQNFIDSTIIGLRRVGLDPSDMKPITGDSYLIGADGAIGFDEALMTHGRYLEPRGGAPAGPAKGFITDPNMNGLPMGEAGDMVAQMTAGAVSGYLFPNEGEERGEAAAMRGAGAFLSPAINKLQAKAGREGGLAVRSTREADKLARAMGAVPGAEVTPEITPQELAKALPKTEAQLKAESTARLKAHAQSKLDEVVQKRAEAQAAPEHVKAFADTTRQYMAEAEAAVGDPPTLRTILKDIPGLGAAARGIDTVVDPASNFTTYHGRKVLAATVAAANYLRTQAGFQTVRTGDMLKALEPILGPEHHGRRALTQAATLAAPAVAGEAAYQLTGDREYREAGILAGLGATAFTSGYQKQTRWKNRGWESIELHAPDDTIPEGIKSGSGKLYDILQHPQRYKLTDEQLQAIKQYESLRDGMMRETNAALQAAGMEELITARDAHGILQWFEPDSVKLALGDHGRGAFRMETPGFDRLRAMQLHRDLGPTFEAALAAHPDLKPLRDPEALLSVEVKMHDQIRANAMLVRSLKESGTGLRIPTEAEYKGMADDARAAYKILVKDRELAGWQKLPGLDDYIFHPEAVKAVDTLLMPSRGRDTGPLAAADMVTNVLRQTMFTADMSAWTMQGAMLAINDPIGTVMNAKHLVGATVFGRKYFDQWVQENKALWTEFTRAGGVPGLEHGGLEKEGLTLSKLPFVGHLEQRGFEAFLPIHRALMYKNLKAEEAFISRLYKKDTLGAKRLAANALKHGPAALGLGAALSEFDVPGLDDDWEKVFLLALGFGGSAAGRKLVDAGVGQSTAKLRTQVAKQVNRTSGSFNRQMYGITAGQAQWERTIMARSPALLRNTIILANKAATDFGPEGAMARWYLVKTAALMGTALAAAEWAATGEMPSLNPADPNSIFSPKNAQFMRADADGAGRLAPSNPLLSLVKAFMRTDPPDGVKRWRSQDWIPLIGLADWYQARQSDLFGPVASAAVRELGRAGQRKLGQAGIGSTGENARLYQEALFQLPVPVVLREMFEAGVVQQTETGKLIQPGTDALGLKHDPSYNDVKERILGVTGSFMGMNVTPESLSRELTRIKTEAVLKRFPRLTDRNGDGVIDYNDLNKEEQALIRGDLEGNQKYNAALQTVEERQRESDEPDPVSNYFDAMEAANAKFEEQMKAIDADYKSKRISAFQAKTFYQAAAESRRDELKYIKQLLGSQLAGKKGTTETVEEYLSRHLKPEDAAVEGYYDLYERATGRDGQLNFDQLEKFQQQYMAKLDPGARAYAERRIASFDRPQITQFGMDYERAKALTQPYWDATEEAFAMVAGKGVFAGFRSYAEFEMAVNEYASQYGVAPSVVLASLSGTREYQYFEKQLTRKRTLLVRANEDIGRALMDFYGKAPPQKTRSYRDYQLFKRESVQNARAGGLEIFDLPDLD